MSNLIFVVSQPRCGSTLLQTLISNNEYVNTASEPWVLLPFITYKSPDIQNGIYNSQLAKLGIEDYVSVTGNNTDLVKIALQNFFKEIYSPLESANTKYILDKTPRYYEILPLITEYFPQAKIIILKRNPLSVLQSIITTWDVQSFPDLSIYARDILNAPFLIENFWEENKNNPNVMEVFYEELTNNPDNEIEKIYNWLELEFNLEVLNYKKNNKMTGSMGDKAGFVQNDKIVQGKSINLNNESPFWRNFFIGYLNYLGNDFLIKYGNYKFDFKLHSTKEFNDFRFVTKMEYFNNRQLSFKNLIKLILYKIRAKFKTEYKY